MITIHVMGDSIVTAYGSDEDNFIGGWGDHLWSFLDKDKVKVNVYAQGGRSSRSFLNEGRFIDTGVFSLDEFPYGMGPVCNRIQPGDYVLMQFCHNDDSSKGCMTYVDRMTPLGTPDENGIYPTIVPTEEMKVTTAALPEEYFAMLAAENATEEEKAANLKKYEELLPTYGATYYPYACGATYKGYLKLYIDKIRELGGIPVLVTGAARQCFDEKGKLKAAPGHHGGEDAFGGFPYVRAVRQLGEQEKVTVLDLFEGSRQLIELLGPSDAESIQSIVGPEGTIGEARYGRPEKWVDAYDRYWQEQSFTKVDGTHQNRLGSYLFAAILAEDIAEQIPELGAYVLEKSAKRMACPKRIAHRIPEIKQLIKRLDIG